MAEIICTMEERFPAPVETVWNLVTDLDHWQWRSDLKGLTITGPDTFTEHGRDGFSTRFTITCRKANALWEFTLENENLTGTWRGEFRAVEDGTRVTFTERIQPRKWWMRLFARRDLQSQQRRYFEDLQRTLVNRAP